MTTTLITADTGLDVLVNNAGIGMPARGPLGTTQ
jgi:NAD(P)-dependent dehydrogenase (short-subunit alcohol dehydrogenase family)